MEQFYYYNQLQKNANKEDMEWLDLLKYALDVRIYHYGQNFKAPYEIYKKREAKYVLKDFLSKSYKKMKFCITPKIQKTRNTKNIISNAYFTVNTEISKLGYNVLNPPWKGYQKNISLPFYSFYRDSIKINKKINELTFQELLSKNFENELEKYYRISCEIYNDYFDALIVPYDMPAMEKLAIKVFKQINKPSFIFLHGLPGRYNIIDDNRTDYLIVWGEMIKNLYINHGFSADKIFVSGHPYYKNLAIDNLRFSLNNILILTTSLNGAQHSNGLILQDRGNLILYLYSIQAVLQKFDIKHVRLRAHPSENIEWYLNYINKDFYEIDDENLSDSLKKSTLVIGPASTVLLESIYTGVNYIVYEPEIDNQYLMGRKTVPPFDGSDKRIPVAKDEETLYHIIKDHLKIDISIWNDYIKTPFDISFIKELI